MNHITPCIGITSLMHPIHHSIGIPSLMYSIHHLIGIPSLMYPIHHSIDIPSLMHPIHHSIGIPCITTPYPQVLGSVTQELTNTPLIPISRGIKCPDHLGRQGWGGWGESEGGEVLISHSTLFIEIGLLCQTFLFIWKQKFIRYIFICKEEFSATFFYFYENRNFPQHFFSFLWK